MFDVLYVEDERSSIRLVEEAFAESGSAVRLHSVRTGTEALEILGCAGDRDDVPRPDLVLLDLDLVELSGFDVLERVKNRPAVCCIPVVVFTTSDANADVEAAYECGANAFVQKPTEFDDLVAFARRAVDFWSDPCPAAGVAQ